MSALLNQKLVGASSFDSQDIMSLMAEIVQLGCIVNENTCLKLPMPTFSNRQIGCAKYMKCYSSSLPQEAKHAYLATHTQESRGSGVLRLF